MIAGSSEDAIQPVIGYGGGGCSDKKFIQIMQFGLKTAGRDDAHKNECRVVYECGPYSQHRRYSPREKQGHEEKKKSMSS